MSATKPPAPPGAALGLPTFLLENVDAARAVVRFLLLRDLLCLASSCKDLRGPVRLHRDQVQDNTEATRPEPDEAPGGLVPAVLPHLNVVVRFVVKQQHEEADDFYFSGRKELSWDLQNEVDKSRERRRFLAGQVALRWASEHSGSLRPIGGGAVEQEHQYAHQNKMEREQGREGEQGPLAEAAFASLGPLAGVLRRELTYAIGFCSASSHTPFAFAPAGPSDTLLPPAVPTLVWLQSEKHRLPAEINITEQAVPAGPLRQVASQVLAVEAVPSLFTIAHNAELFRSVWNPKFVQVSNLTRQVTVRKYPAEMLDYDYTVSLDNLGAELRKILPARQATAHLGSELFGRRLEALSFAICCDEPVPETNRPRMSAPSVSTATSTTSAREVVAQTEGLPGQSQAEEARFAEPSSVCVLQTLLNEVIPRPDAASRLCLSFSEQRLFDLPSPRFATLPPNVKTIGILLIQHEEVNIFYGRRVGTSFRKFENDSRVFQLPHVEGVEVAFGDGTYEEPVWQVFGREHQSQMYRSTSSSTCSVGGRRVVDAFVRMFPRLRDVAISFWLSSRALYDWSSNRSLGQYLESDGQDGGRGEEMAGAAGPRTTGLRTPPPFVQIVKAFKERGIRVLVNDVRAVGARRSMHRDDEERHNNSLREMFARALSAGPGDVEV